MLSLTNQYLSHLFDSCLHEEILSYRIRRNYRGEKKITSQHDAIRSVKYYLSLHKDKEIYVAECDIRKFFDILNHNIIKREFETLLKKTGADLFLSPDGYLSLGSKVPSIAVFHDLNFEHYPGDLPLAERWYYRTFFRKYASKAARIATVSGF